MISEHFTKDEFKCKCGCGGLKYDPKLLTLLEQLRAEIGQPVYITSGYRCPAHNKAVGGAKDSFHMKGMAADIVVPKHSPFDIKKVAERLGFGGIGTYVEGGNFFTHVDVGPQGRRWSD